ncbi:hypothetical protein Pfo_028521 [Paulownia fortunei]|nr:hypothetical protein Pfo_028521 [Paulownia fortunei]
MGASLSNLTEKGSGNGGRVWGTYRRAAWPVSSSILRRRIYTTWLALTALSAPLLLPTPFGRPSFPPITTSSFTSSAIPMSIKVFPRKISLPSSPALSLLSTATRHVVWVDRFTGRVCMSISAKAMAITGIEDRRYWNWIPTEESRFDVVAYLQQMWWFEVDGLVKFPFPPDIYTLSFRIHLGRFSKRLGRRICNFDHTHGWDIKPVRFELSTSDGQQASSECFLDDTQQDDANGNFKCGCWIEYNVGEFIVSELDSETEVRFSMKQIDCTHSKGGLCIDSVAIIPSELKECRRRGLLK